MRELLYATIMKMNNPDQRQAMLAAIIDSSEDAIISKDLSSRITSWNRAAQKMFGYSEEEMVGQLIHVLIPENRRSEEEEIISQLRQGKRIEHYETIRLTKTGRELQISLTISPIRDSTGVIIGASKIARDITRQKQYEERLRIINEVGKSISAQLDINTVLQTITDAATRLSGASFGAFFYNKVDSRGESYMLYALSGASREAFDKFGMPRNTAIFRETFDGVGNVRSSDITKDQRYGKNTPHSGMPKGHLPVVSYLAVPVISQTGVVIGGLFFGHGEPDMFTEEHEILISAISTQAAIAIDNAKLYEEINLLNNKKDEFIAFASHELKTPLTTIKGYLQIAGTTNIPLKDVLPKINKQVNRLEGIIADLLDISKIQAGKLDLHFEKMRLVDLLKESIESVDLSKHNLQVENPPEETVIAIDRQKMSRVLINLFTNAVKYSPPNTLITVSAIRIGDQVQITIKDYGIGIAEQHLGNIFNQFYRVSAEEHQTQGTGLGLYIAKEIIEAHFGKIWAESELGNGSSFHISFPIERSKTLK